MNRELFGLAVQGIRRKRRSSLLLFTVLLLSFAFAIVSLTVTGSIQATNEEYRLDTYGEWYGVIRNGWDEDEDFLREQEWLDCLGITKSYGAIAASTSGSTSIGVVDEGFLKVGRLGLQDGRFPQNAGEIAMEADLLSALGYDYTLGQEITFTVNVPATASVMKEGALFPSEQSVAVQVERTYILCGVIREYSDLWMRGSSAFANPQLNSAVIVPEAAEELRKLAEAALIGLQEIAEWDGELTELTLDEAVPQYHFSVLPGSEDQAKEDADKYLKSTRTMGAGDRGIKVNGILSDSAQEEAVETFFAWLILAVTLLSVICIYAIRIPDEARQLATFRSIGITRRQLCVMLMYETLLLAVPAIVLGTGAGALGIWALLWLAVYSGSAPIQVVIPPVLLSVAAALWLVGVLAARLAVFLVALRSPLTGRFHIARKKARRYRNLQRALVAGLSALLCAAVVFTVVESLEPISTIRYMNTLPDYTVYRKGDNWYSPNATSWYLASNYEDGGYRNLDFTVPKDAAVSISQVPGVKQAWGWGWEYVRLEFDGMDEAPLVDAVKDYHYFTHVDGLPFGIGPYNENAFPVILTVVDEGDWDGIIDFDIDMDKFRSGEAVLMSFCVGTGGKFITGSSYGYSSGEYEETGVSMGDTIRITVGTSEVYATVETEIGGIVTYTATADTGGLFGLFQSYSIICSEAFLNKLLDALGPDEPWHEFRQGTPYGYEEISVYVDQTADYLSTDAVLAALCSQADLKLDAYNREIKQVWIERETQTLLLLLPGGGCVILVLLLILGNTLSMEAQRQKRDFGILQAVGMSRRQLSLKQSGTAVGRGVLGTALGWLAYGGYCMVYAARERAERLLENDTAPAIRELIAEKLSDIIQYYGDWQVILPLTAICIGLILAVSWLAKRRLTREDLMAKLRDEH